MADPIQDAINELAKAINSITDKRQRQAVLDAIDKLRKAVNAEFGKLTIKGKPWMSIEPWM